MTNQHKPADAVLRTGGEERDYLFRRSEDHRRLAEMATETGAKAVHLRLSHLYEDRARRVDMVLLD